jgi:hypothetical protein
MNVQRNFVLGVQCEILMTTGGTFKKERCIFSHHGFLIVNWYCQNGIPLKYVYDLRSRLVGPHAVSGMFVKERRQDKQKKNPGRFLCLPAGDNIAMKDRQLETWFRHCHGN